MNVDLVPRRRTNEYSKSKIAFTSYRHCGGTRRQITDNGGSEPLVTLY